MKFTCKGEKVRNYTNYKFCKQTLTCYRRIFTLSCGLEFRNVFIKQAQNCSKFEVLENKLPAIPFWKYNQDDMCLAWIELWWGLNETINIWNNLIKWIYLDMLLPFAFFWNPVFRQFLKAIVNKSSNCSINPKIREFCVTPHLGKSEGTSGSGGMKTDNTAYPAFNWGVAKIVIY